MKAEKSKFRLPIWLVFSYIYTSLIFPLGLYTLLAGPSKWVITLAQKFDWTEGFEKWIQRFVILTLFVLTFLLTLAYIKYIHHNRNLLVRRIFIAILSLLFIVSIYIFAFKPEIFIKLSGENGDTQTESTQSDSGGKIEFVMGPYPDLNGLKQLKANGFVGVVSLLHELVLPAEPTLISQEANNASQAGMALIHIPMLPWVSGNNESILKIQKLVREGHGKYYVHCYLGRDRVNVFRKIVKDMGLKSESLQSKNLRQIDELNRFERGEFTKLSKDVYLTPYPTDEEFFGYIINGQFNSVVSLQDEKNSEDTVWIAKEKEMLSRYGIQFINIPVSSASNLKALKILTDSFPKIKKPVLIHKFNSTDPLYQVIIKKLGAQRN